MAGDSIISFRFSEEEVKALKAHAKPAESLSLAAKRLLRQTLQVSTAKSTDASTLALTSVDDVVSAAVNSTVDKLVDNPKLEERVEAIVEERFAGFVASINQKFAEQEERLESLEKLPA